jgi:septum formation protein
MIGVRHEVIPADIDERYLDGEGAAAHAGRLAREKCAKISASHSGAFVIAADTIVVIDGDILGKPRDEAEADAMLSRLSGRRHTVHTGVAVEWNGGAEFAVESATVTFREIDASRRQAYIATGEPMDKAGAYGIQGYGATLVARVEGDYFAVMGLPLCLTIALAEMVGARYAFGGLSAAER